MTPIKVFYHLFIPPDPRAAMWTWYVDEQLKLIRSSKLHNLAEINMTITMPMLWSSIFDIGFTSNVDVQHKLTFYEKVREYINTRYPFCNILEFIDIPANQMEGGTLKHLYHQSIEEDFFCLYFHSKGVVSASPCTANWREVLNYFHVEQWPNAIKLLKDYQVLGVKDAKTDHTILSGNYFWARSDYIRSLPNPLDTSKYTNDPSLWPTGQAYRYGLEKWILSNNPTVHYFIDTEVDHFMQYCFLEDIIKKI